MKLTPGKFYASKDGFIWCCFRLALGEPAHCRAGCIRISDGRVEQFYTDGRYDSKGEREHTLVREMDAERAIIPSTLMPPSLR